MFTRRIDIGSAGRAPRRLARRRAFGSVLAVGVGTVVAGALLVTGAPALALATLIGAVWLRATLIGRAARAAAGGRAEQRVADRLGRLRADVVIFNARLPGTRADVDVIALGPMAAAVEIKLGAGRVRTTRDGRVLVAGRALPGRPLHQAIAMAAATRRAAGLGPRVDAVLCVSEMKQRPKLLDVDGNEVWLTSARHLRRVLRRLPRTLGRTAALDAAEAFR